MLYDVKLHAYSPKKGHFAEGISNPVCRDADWEAKYSFQTKSFRKQLILESSSLHKHPII
jgi:hypothetical protein